MRSVRAIQQRWQMRAEDKAMADIAKEVEKTQAVFIPIAIDNKENIEDAGNGEIKFTLPMNTMVVDCDGDEFDAGYWHGKCPKSRMVNDGNNWTARGFARIELPEMDPEIPTMPCIVTLERDYADVDDEGKKTHDVLRKRFVESQSLARASRKYMTSRFYAAEETKRAKQLLGFREIGPAEAQVYANFAATIDEQRQREEGKAARAETKAKRSVKKPAAKR